MTRSFLLALAAVIALFACTRQAAVSIIGPDGAVRGVVNVEIVNTPAQREVGLMYRKHLDEGAGMLFVFPTSDRLQFWMHNTEIPLDMIFADGDGRVIGIVANARPYSDQQVGVEGESKYVLEVNGGFCARNGIKAGDRFNFTGFIPHAES
ncbi:MAG TPA: DUF192 domain-containing protein [Candidatus Binataceae bacterium]